MEAFLDVSRWVHIVLGFGGLVLFWVPVFAKKGGRVHTGAGKWFVRCAYVVLGTAGLSVLLRLGSAFAEGIGPRDHPESFAFIVFLGYLAWVTFVMVRHGVLVLRTKSNPAAYRTTLNMGLAWSAVGASLVIIGYALWFDPPLKILLFALSPIGVLVGWGIRDFAVKPPASKRAWFYEHMNAMLGSGIAFHTAFAVFGMSRFFDLGLTGWVAIVPWVLPTAIGVPAGEVWTRYYKRKFGELPKAETASPVSTA